LEGGGNKKKLGRDRENAQESVQKEGESERESEKSGRVRGVNEMSPPGV
jgi:hypothetical protein